MAKRKFNNKSNKQLSQEWQAFRDNLAKETAVDKNEDFGTQQKRIKQLEANPEAWFQYYFPNYYKSEPAPFHIKSTKRILRNPEWYEVRAWSRELAKSTRTMMEVLRLGLTGKKKNVILVSNSADNAERLLTPYKINLEANGRITHDYGKQEKLGSWEATEFITRTGVAFRAIGAGQSPRGTRNEAIRPDVILIDDIDTDEDCRNTEIIDKRWKWIEEALIPTRSISGHLLLIFCGNIIAEDCCITRAIKKADKVDVINIRDKNGKSTWPTKNTEEAIDRVLSTISYAAQQKEFFNNPISEGKTFKEITWGKVPAYSKFDFVLQYADPATSNKDKPSIKSGLQNSQKGTVLMGYSEGKYYVITCFLDNMGQSDFIDGMYQIRNIVRDRAILYSYMENNTLQDPFYQQVLAPLIYRTGLEKYDNNVLPIITDERKKPEKWYRIEADLEPVVRLGMLVFNEAEKENPHMQRLETQFLGAHANAKLLDGPDMVQGGYKIIQEKMAIKEVGNVQIIRRRPNKKRY